VAEDSVEADLKSQNAPESALRNKPKPVLEMLGDSLREMAVLLAVFFPLEQAFRGTLGVRMNAVILVLAAVLLLVGILFEKWK
jgi:hypothetical protein